LALLSVSCHRSGTWVDDPANFRRAFGYPPPDGVVLTRSWYWRSPHFFREESLLFSIAAPRPFIDAILSANAMEPFDFSGLRQLSTPCVLDDWPAWFAPGPAETYQSWRCPGSRQCLALVDLDRGELFLYVCQL